MSDKARMTFRFDREDGSREETGRSGEGRQGAKIVPLRKSADTAAGIASAAGNRGGTAGREAGAMDLADAAFGVSAPARAEDEDVGSDERWRNGRAEERFDPYEDTAELERLIREADGQSVPPRGAAAAEWAGLAGRLETASVRPRGGAAHQSERGAPQAPGRGELRPDGGLPDLMLRPQWMDGIDTVKPAIPPQPSGGPDGSRKLAAVTDTSRELEYRPAERMQAGGYDAAEDGGYHTNGHGPAGRSGGPSWLKVIASLTGALATGALFGYIVLSLFTGQPALPGLKAGKSGGAVLPADTAAGADGAANGKGGANEAAGGGAASKAGLSTITLQPRSYYLLQYGVFSTRGGMEAAAEELRARGLAAAVDTTDGYRVFAGAAADLDGAHALAAELDGLQVFAKSIPLPESIGVPAGTEEAVRGFAEESGRLIALLGAYTAGRLAGSETEDWTAAHQRWTEKAAVLRQSLPKATAARTAADRVANALDTAAASLGEYARKPAEAHLWSAQAALAEAVLALKSWS